MNFRNEESSHPLNNFHTLVEFWRVWQSNKKNVEKQNTRKKWIFLFMPDTHSEVWRNVWADSYAKGR